MPALARAREAARRASCANNLKQLGLVFKMYSNESKGGKLPPSRYAEYATDQTCTKVTGFDFMFQGSCVYPEYLSDAKIMLCPSDASWDYDYERFFCDWDQTQVCPCRWNSRSYNYTPFLLSPELLLQDPTNINPQPPLMDYLNMDMLITITAIGTDQADIYAQAAWVDKDWPCGDQTVYRLREGIERFLITDINNPAASAKAQSEISVIWDEISTEIKEFNHIPGGSNVLFLDGHVEFIKYPGEWPVTTMVALITGQ
ncbi:MAG: DUF1559 domain-containing protein [Candidatus Hydrogenedentes bacterium]|nr:DUF1559 domain-containing protein [Candidatus Hydrogenedentota bacterium]